MTSLDRVASSCLKFLTKINCFRWRRFNWFCNAENSTIIVYSLSCIFASLNPSFNQRHLSFSVEIVMFSTGDVRSLIEMWGKMYFAAYTASIHAAWSSMDLTFKWIFFVPVKIENLLSSYLLSWMEDTFKCTSSRGRHRRLGSTPNS